MLTRKKLAVNRRFFILDKKSICNYYFTVCLLIFLFGSPVALRIGNKTKTPKNHPTALGDKTKATEINMVREKKNFKKLFYFFSFKGGI